MDKVSFKKIRVIFLFAFLVLLIHLFSLQIVRHSYYLTLAKNNYIRTQELRAPRGDITDSKGRLLAQDRPSYQVVVIPQEVKDTEAVFEGLAQILEHDLETIKSRYRHNYFAPFHPVAIQTIFDKKKAFYIAEQVEFMQGVDLIVQPSRNYFYAKELSHALGYIGFINPRKQSMYKQYGFIPPRLVGYSGIEEFYNEYLKGEDGFMQWQVDSLGRKMNMLGFKSPVKGKSLQLSIDVEAQQIANLLLEGKNGAIILMDSDTGAIRVMASSPSFDSNDFVPGKRSAAKIREYFADPHKPMLFRAMQSAHPLGSVFKIVLSTAGLSREIITSDTTFECAGGLEVGRRIFRCAHVHGIVTVRRALRVSCNVFFYHVGKAIGIEEIVLWARQFGLGNKTGIDLSGESDGNIPDSASRLRWYEGEIANLSIGQGEILATPLQAVRLVNAVATGGYLVTPHLIEQIDGEYIQPGSIQYVKGIKQDALQMVRQGLRDVVASEEGTAHVLSSLRVSVAGKTGTAQVSTGSNHAWFVCFFPYEDPQYSLVVFIEHGVSSSLAVSLTYKFIKELIQKGIIEAAG